MRRKPPDLTAREGVDQQPSARPPTRRVRSVRLIIPGRYEESQTAENGRGRDSRSLSQPDSLDTFPVSSAGKRTAAPGSRTPRRLMGDPEGLKPASLRAIGS